MYFFSHSLENGVKQKQKKNPAEIIAGQVTVQSEKESLLSKKLRKLEKKDKSKYSTTEINQLSSVIHICLLIYDYGVLSMF